MRTNIDIDDGLMQAALTSGPFKTKKDAVEAGLKLLARQARYRELLRWEGKLPWQGDLSLDWSANAVTTEQRAAVTQEATPKPSRRDRS